MNEIISIVILLFEVLLVLQCLQIAFKQEIQFDKYTIGIILIDVSIYLLINLRIIPVICSAVLYLLFFGYCYVEFKQKISKTLVGFTIGFVLAGCIESVLAFTTNFYRNDNNSMYILMISSVTACLLIYCVRKGVKILKLGKTTRDDFDIYGVTALLGFSMIVMLVDYYWIQKRVNIYFVCVVVFLVVLLFCLYRLELTRKEIEKSNYELELQSIYGGAYENLISDVRRRQHDFKNQLGAIYSMHLVASSMDELICMQKEYGNTIQCESKFDSILTNCNNPILAGYLYHRCLLCERDDILVDCNIHIDQAKCCFQLHEIIEVFGILFDNAAESVLFSHASCKLISVDFIESEDTLIISVSNPSRYITYSEIEKMFARGYSTKGENRGLGLVRVFELTTKYNTELKVSNFQRDENNWINFKIKIRK